MNFIFNISNEEYNKKIDDIDGELEEGEEDKEEVDDDRELEEEEEDVKEGIKTINSFKTDFKKDELLVDVYKKKEEEKNNDSHEYVNLENDEQEKKLSNILNVIDSLESLKIKYSLNEDISVSRETVEPFSQHITMIYNSNNVREDFPVHISADEISYSPTDNRLYTFNKIIDERIYNLKKECNDIYSDYYIRTMKSLINDLYFIFYKGNKIFSLINIIEEKWCFDKNKQTPYIDKYLTISNKLNLNLINKRIIKLINEYISDNKFVNNYIESINELYQKIDNYSDNSENNIEEYLNGLNAPLLSIGYEDADEDNKDLDFIYKSINISDSNCFYGYVPLTGGSLIPPPYRHISKENNSEYDYYVDCEPIEKDEIISLIKDLYRAINNLPSLDDETNFVSYIKEKIDNVCDNHISFKIMDDCNKDEMVKLFLFIPFSNVINIGFSNLVNIFNRYKESNLMGSDEYGNNSLNDIISNRTKSEYKMKMFIYITSFYRESFLSIIRFLCSFEKLILSCLK